MKIKGWSVFLRSRHSMAFVNRKCVVPGRKFNYLPIFLGRFLILLNYFLDVLIIPVRVTKRLLDLSSEEVADLFLTARRVQQGMERFLNVSSSTLNVQDGPDAGQSIEVYSLTILILFLFQNCVFFLSTSTFTFYRDDQTISKTTTTFITSCASTTRASSTGAVKTI